MPHPDRQQGPGPDGDVWLQTGRVRRDCAPHRAALLGNLGTAALVLGVLAVLFCGLTGFLALPLGIAVWNAAETDLERMQAGLMNPDGREATRGAGEQARQGAILGGAAAACWFAFLGLFYLLLSTAHVGP
jgi:hypothetical protein